MRILALVPGGIGDQILFFPTLEDLKQKYPNSTLDVIVEPRAKSAYRICPYVHEVLLFDFKDRNGLADYLNLLGVIRDREYDVAISLPQRWTIGLLLWLNGIPVRVGYKTNTSVRKEFRTPIFLTNAVPLKTEQYAAYMYHDLLQGLDIQTPTPPLKVTLPKDDIDWAEAEQKRLEIKDTGYIIIHGGSSTSAAIKGVDKNYPLPQWQKIVDEILAKQPDLPIVLLQGPEDPQWVKQLLEGHPNLKVTKPTDVGKLAAIIAGANLMLCTDSPPMHLSVAVGTYTIALFGPTVAEKLLPPDPTRYIGIQSKSGNLADIKPETILEAMWRG
ncbi:glycosyltransferase family 9 protein [Gloeothece verrucosa]|uniref:Glycosyl transferase family 9 n=1 Tax=Gloeothece verrucosa (strain PCC 7822) TaxID=497965 RepID=E0UJZ4_GLOV7|nr:glycosyltransferase family 9 protein [Gloeothece verrucosa]ADN14630.1 glycosyl transferase family 9 [Gloeothece verrucosa PCC 7822]